MDNITEFKYGGKYIDNITEFKYITLVNLLFDELDLSPYGDGYRIKNDKETIIVLKHLEPGMFKERAEELSKKS